MQDFQKFEIGDKIQFYQMPLQTYFIPKYTNPALKWVSKKTGIKITCAVITYGLDNSTCSFGFYPKNGNFLKSCWKPVPAYIFSPDPYYTSCSNPTLLQKEDGTPIVYHLNEKQAYLLNRYFQEIVPGKITDEMRQSRYYEILYRKSESKYNHIEKRHEIKIPGHKYYILPGSNLGKDLQWIFHNTGFSWFSSIFPSLESDLGMKPELIGEFDFNELEHEGAFFY